MKKPLYYVLIFAISLLIWQHTEASYNGVLLKNAPIKKDVTLQSKKELENMVILPEESFDEDEVRAILYRLDHIPNILLQQADEQNIKVRLFQQNLTDFSTTRHLKGVTPRGYTNTRKTWDDVPGIGGSKLVLVKIGHSEKGKGHGSVNLELHELAHSLDRYVFNTMNDDITFIPIWQKEASLLFPGESYFIDYQEEYFAETFAMYFLNLKTRKLLLKKAPMTYDYFKKLESL